jgi:glycosyltransferase involved in cell wall biosynthesis
MTFLFAGQCSVRKGTPLLLDAWLAAGLADAGLLLAGSWGLAEAKKRQLPANCDWLGPLSQERLRAVYRDTDVFVLPTNFEGSPLVIGEALACGLPVLTTQGRGADSILDEESSRSVPPDDLDALVEALRWFAGNRDRIPAMSRAARANAERWPWQRYRASVAAAVKDLI